ncbi:MAG TPA: ABC transporter permease [Chitinophagaceae bacterium]|nr:ABC transporter permease [Chitinophagaceae bacterium]
MIKNYLLVALRNIRKNKTFSFINITGLALGMACSLLIMLWVNDERSMDKFNKNTTQLYSIYERQYYDNKIDAFHATPGVLADEMKRVLPDVQYASNFAWNEDNTFQVGDKIIKEKGNHAGIDFFKMFSYPLLAGNPATALNTPATIAISRKMANDFFGTPQNAMGKTIRFENRKDFIVSAVFEDLGENMSDKFDFLINWHAFLEDNDWAKDWGNNGPRTYIMLKAGADPVAFEKHIKLFLDNYNKDQGPKKGFRIELGMQRFDDMYLHSNFGPDGKLEGGRIEYVRLFSIVAIFILIIACINFMNLTTARSIKRSKEIGVRKVVGAFRSSLIRQFIGEAILLSFMAVVVAMILVAVLLPFFNTLTQKHISYPGLDIYFWISIIVLTLITGLVSGSYPALFLSSFNPVVVLKGLPKFSASTVWFRKGLVVFQFVLSIVLIIGTIVVSKQINFIQTKNLGYDRENLIYIPLDGDLTKQYELLKQQALNIPGIKYISRISQTPTSIENGTYGVDWDGKEQNSKPMFTNAAIGYDFIKTMNIKLLQGRDFSKEYATDSSGYIVNETALKKIGYKNPIGARLTFWGKKGTIVGVVKDFHFNSLKVPVNALIMRLGEKDDWGWALIKTQGGQTKQAIAGLERICKQLNPKFPFTYQFSDKEYEKLYTSELMVGKLANAFAFLAIFISCLGLLGLAMFTAEQRTKEIGIRKVLGASIGSVFTLLSKEFLLLVIIALLIATPIAWYSMYKWLQEYHYRTDITWWMFVIAGFTAIMITLFTVSFQAIKAAVANPVKSLRSE